MAPAPLLFPASTSQRATTVGCTSTAIQANRPHMKLLLLSSCSPGVSQFVPPPRLLLGRLYQGYSRPIPPSATIISSYQNSSPSARANDEISVRTSNPPLFAFVVSRGYGVPLPKPGYKFYCAEHNKHIRNKSGWTRHQKEKHHKELSLKCPHCDNTFDQTYSLKRHVDNVHRKLRLYKCDACDITWQEKKDLVKHNAKHHPSQ
ncbi:hypothetical protein DL95DRAFT_460175 [Leptodontidium sp. 2 PMI_412]|nr:hypothetical protein DL95DRAFT_460175 [Leptodontidium sp. 2 PMI_412]